MKTPFVWLSVPLLAACAASAPVWQKSGASESAINEDLQQCRVQVRTSPDASILAAAPTIASSASPMIDRSQERDARDDQEIRKCMQGKGYSLTR
jgi:hypothetical protein